MWNGWAPIGFVVTLLLPAAGTAQESWTWDLTGRVGLYRTADDFGPATKVSQIHFLDIREVDPAAFFGLQADLNLPVEGLALSLRGMVTLPSEVEGGLSCLPGYYCVAMMLPVEGEIRTLAGTVGLLYRPWSDGHPIRPFLTAGFGLKQDRFSWPEQENGALVGTGRSVTSGAALFGAGFDLVAGPVPLRIEVADLWTPEGDRMGRGSLSSAWPPRRKARHDLSVSAGVVIGFH